MILTPEPREFDEMNLAEPQIQEAISVLTSNRLARKYRAEFITARKNGTSLPRNWPGIVYVMWPNNPEVDLPDQEPMVSSIGNGQIDHDTKAAARLLLQDFANKIAGASLTPTAQGIRHDLYVQYDCKGGVPLENIDLPHCDETDFAISVLTPQRKPFKQLKGTIEIEDSSIPHGIWRKDFCRVYQGHRPLHETGTSDVRFYDPSRAIVTACTTAIASGKAEVVPMRCGALYHVANTTPHFRGEFVEEGFRVVLHSVLDR